MRIIVTIQIIPEDLAAHLALLQVEIVICHLTFDVPGNVKRYGAIDWCSNGNNLNG